MNRPEKQGEEGFWEGTGPRCGSWVEFRGMRSGGYNHAQHACSGLCFGLRHRAVPRLRDPSGVGTGNILRGTCLQWACCGDASSDKPVSFGVDENSWRSRNAAFRPGFVLPGVSVTWPPRELRVGLHWPLPSDRHKAELVVKT